ncbi:hypothetical protein AAHA92_33919 [Salvia divinorum]|uniref:Uncharacterized protein n=1 Tax=Salvia divinorum TaxID=28513 RepID=A0ABD1FH78_SALDI
MCHLPVEVEHRAYWAELEKLRLESFGSAIWYKERTKLWHNKNLRTKELQVGQKVLLFQSRLKLMPGKLKSKWSGLYIITVIHSNRAVEISGSAPNSEPFIVSGHRLKVFRDNTEVCVVEELPLHARHVVT